MCWTKLFCAADVPVGCRKDSHVKNLTIQYSRLQWVVHIQSSSNISSTHLQYFQMRCCISAFIADKLRFQLLIYRTERGGGYKECKYSPAQTIRTVQFWSTGMPETITMRWVKYMGASRTIAAARSSNNNIILRE